MRAKARVVKYFSYHVRSRRMIVQLGCSDSYLLDYVYSYNAGYMQSYSGISIVVGLIQAYDRPKPCSIEGQRNEKYCDEGGRMLV